MELYKTTSYELAKRLTERYSTSFSASCRLFDKSIRSHIYAIYGMVRVADEIVDVYRGNDAKKVLTEFEQEGYAAIKRQYSTNPIVHAFAITAKAHGIDRSLIAPFFASMAMDIPGGYSPKQYSEYIYGSAEVVGLMCLKVFTGDNAEQYDALQKGAQALGAAYQKVNFLRDIASDYTERERVYFPNVKYESFDDEAKRRIETDIADDFALAEEYVLQLPGNAQAAVALSVVYYEKLLERIQRVSASELKMRRVRVPNHVKVRLFVQATLRGRA